MRIVENPNWHADLRRDLDRRVEDNIVNEITEDAIRGAPIATGRMAYTIHWFKVGPDTWWVYSPAPYTLYVEFNTRAHPIRAKRARALHWIDELGHHYAREVMHPGTKEQPFMRPATYKVRPL